MKTSNYLWIIAVGVIVWLLSRSASAAPCVQGSAGCDGPPDPTAGGSVTLGTPTVVGSGATQLGNTDYLTTVVPPGTP